MTVQKMASELRARRVFIINFDQDNIIMCMTQSRTVGGVGLMNTATLHVHCCPVYARPKLVLLSCIIIIISMYYAHATHRGSAMNIIIYQDLV